MKSLNKEAQACINFISNGYRSVGLPQELLIRIFNNNDYCLSDYYHSAENRHEQILEIQTEEGVLRCRFDEVGDCCVCRALPESREYMEHCLEMCNFSFRNTVPNLEWEFCSIAIRYGNEGDKPYLEFTALQ